jgi:hypothetical protein
MRIQRSAPCGQAFVDSNLGAYLSALSVRPNIFSKFGVQNVHGLRICGISARYLRTVICELLFVDRFSNMAA